MGVEAFGDGAACDCRERHRSARSPLRSVHVADLDLVRRGAHPCFQRLPSRWPNPLPVSTEHEELRSLIVAGGATPHVEHGVLFGEVRGLEVCRVVDSPTTGFLGELSELAEHLPADEGGLRLEVGVGAADREAFQLLHGEVPTVEALVSVVQAVETHRSTDSPQHPLNRLGVERFLRWQAEQTPALVGCASLTPGQPPLPRPNLKDPDPVRRHRHRHTGRIDASGVLEWRRPRRTALRRRRASDGRTTCRARAARARPVASGVRAG